MANTQPRMQARWANIPGTSHYSGLGIRVIENAIAAGLIRSCMPLSFAGAKRGRRLVDLRSVDAWLEAGLTNKADVSQLVRTDRKAVA